MVFGSFLGASRMRVVRSRDIKGAVTLRLSGVDNKTARPVPASLKTGRTFLKLSVHLKIFVMRLCDFNELLGL